MESATEASRDPKGFVPSQLHVLSSHGQSQNGRDAILLHFLRHAESQSSPSSLLRFLRGSCRILRGAEEPDKYKQEPPSDGDPNARDPRVCATDDIGPRPLVVRVVAHSDGSLLVNVGQKGTLVGEAEVKDAVLVGQLERGAKDSGFGAARDGGKVDAVVGREHGDLELDLVAGWGLVRRPAVAAPLRELDGICL